MLKSDNRQQWNDISECSLPNRLELIANYLSDKLSDKEVADFEAHYFGCKTCLRELRIEQEISNVVQTERNTVFSNLLRSREQTKNSKHIIRQIYIAAAAAIIIVGSVFGIRMFFEAEYHELAALTSSERESLNIISRNDSTIATEFSNGAEAILVAPENRFGFIPHFDQEQVRLAVIHLQKAFETTADPFEKAKLAYFLGKAHLMKADTKNAQYWLQIAVDQNVDTYSDKASFLVLELKKAKQ